MHSLNKKYLDNLTFTPEELSTLRAIGEYRGKQALYYEQSPEILKSLKQVSIIESSESSNRLEGIVAPHKRIADLVTKNSSPKNRSEQEIAGYRDALNLIHQSAIDMPSSLNVILQLHAWLYRYLPDRGGAWKTTNNEITEIYPDGKKRTRFIPCSAFDTPRAMEGLVSGYRKCIHEWNAEPLLVIPAFVLDFLCIHPFRDGNGRTVRLITLLLLYHFGYQVGRYISLERIFEESRDSYYDTLEKSSHNWHAGEHDLKPWLTYFWGVLMRAHKEFEKRVGTLIPHGNKAERVKLCIEESVGAFSISDLERSCPSVSRDTIRRVLRQQRDAGVIMPVGKGRAAKWVRKD